MTIWLQTELTHPIHFGSLVSLVSLGWEQVGNLDELLEDEIAFDNHCYGCTAGMGSS